MSTSDSITNAPAVLVAQPALELIAELSAARAVTVQKDACSAERRLQRAQKTAAAERERAQRAAPDGEALGNNADFVSPAIVEAVLPPPTTIKAWRMRSYGREILTRAGINRRLRWCGSRIKRGSDGVGVYRRPDRPYGRVNGVCVCGQSLCCPVCGPRIAAVRSGEVSAAFKVATSMGYEARLVTFTIPHTLGSTLGTEIDCFATAWRAFQTGKRGVERRRHSLGNHVGREVTWGAKNGWHYHHHMLRYDEPATFDEKQVHAQWLAALEGVGRKWRGAELHAFDCGTVGDEAHAAYVGKLATAVESAARAIGSEVASSATKGKNLATLLQLATVGDTQAGRVWVAGVADIVDRKVSSVRWSRGLRDKLGLQTEKGDEQVAAEEVLSTDEFLGALTAMQWRGILMHRAEFALLCAANQGEEAVNSFLAGLELGKLNDDARPAVVVPLQDETCYTGFVPSNSSKDTI